MPNTTTNYGFYKPLVNDATDQDLWGAYLNANFDVLESVLDTRTRNYNFADFILSRPELKDYSETLQTVTSTSNAATADYTSGQHVAITLSENISTLTLSNPPATGRVGAWVFYLKQGGSGSYTVTWPASVKWAGGTTPTLTTTVGRTDEITLLTRDGGTTYSGAVRGLNYTI